MLLIEIGQMLRRLREDKNLTQGELASLAGVARSTLSGLEAGTRTNVSAKTLNTLLALVGGELVARPIESTGMPDYVTRAVRTANVSLRGRLHADDLVQALLTGKVPANRAPHIQAVLEDLSASNLAGLVEQLEQLSHDPATVRQALQRLLSSLGQT